MSASKKNTKQQDQNVTLDSIKELFEKMFKKHEETIKSIISSNNKIMNDRLDKLSNDICDFKHSLEFTQHEFTTKIKNVNEELKLIKEQLVPLNEGERCMEEIKNKLVDLEDRSRRQNLRIDGINEEPNESWDECKKKVQDLFKETLGIEERIEIDRAHRTGTRRGGKQRTIILKLSSCKDKTIILKNGKRLKGTGIYLYEDFSRETMELRKKLWEDVKRHRDHGKFSYLQYRTVVVRDNPLSH